MRLRGLEEYSIGLDIGTASVGWCVLDAHGDLSYMKGKPAWGSRLFPSAEPAADARIARGQRRRYIRRRWRLDLLRSFFQEDMDQLDPDFFIRLRQSRLLPEDRNIDCRDYRYPLFNDADFTEQQYYERFPTIYHLRAWLMETDEKADLRLIYLALHNIVKHRGNFLRQGERFSAKDANTAEAIEDLCTALDEWCEAEGLSCTASTNVGKIRKTLEDQNVARSARRDDLVKLFAIASVDSRSDAKKFAKALASAIVGLQADMKDIFGAEGESTKLRLSDEEKVEAFRQILPSEGEPLFDAMQATYSAFILSGILSSSEPETVGKSISFHKIAEYEKYKEDLKLLKALVRKYRPDAYDGFFRGEFYRNADGTRTNIYDKKEAKGYTRYNLGVQASSYDDFSKEVERLLKGTEAENDPDYQDMRASFGEERFLRRLKTSDNGAIPYQLHLEEMWAILQNQGQHYPFLLKEADKIESLVTFRIPYYVGPLTMLNAPQQGNSALAAVEGEVGKHRFAWSVRKPGKEFASVKPWDWDEIIDTHASAEAFIMRMTGTCTYLQGEDVLPKESLLYQEYCVLNELNGAHWTEDGDADQRFDAADREGIVCELFQRRRGRITYKMVEDWLVRECHAAHPHVSGGQGESGFESKLSSYGFFCDVLGVDALPESSIGMVENIILWNTLFEDRSILKQKIKEAYGDVLDEDQIKKICKKRMTGWGRLSRKFLTGLRVDTDGGRKSIMDVLREGNPTNGARSRAMVLMEVINDDDLAFDRLIDEHNREYAGDLAMHLEDLPGSPALRRGINQALRIVDEIAHIAGHAPANIFIEVTRGEDTKRPRGQRTKKRFEKLQEALNAFKEENPDLFDSSIMRELKDRKDALNDEQLMLYFMQNGKSLYSGKPLDINLLGTGTYEVDHIIPRAYIKDDSLDNKALVLKEENQRKLDSLLLDEGLQRSQSSRWKTLHKAGLISDKKLRNLTRTSIGDNALKGFINRQIVETSQIVKLVRLMLEEKYKDTRVRSINANLSHNLREALDLPKCREANDFHHAHDAYLAYQVGRFVQECYPIMFEQPIALTHVVRKFVRSQGQEFKQNRKTPGSAGFIVDRFTATSFDADTGEVFWHAGDEIARIKRCLGYKQCFIARMPEVTGGAFWDATIYSPRSGKNLGLPLKEGLDPQKYGSFSREQFAYFFIYEGSDKKGRPFFGFEPVPVRIASAIERDPAKLEEYARQQAEAAGATFTRVARRKVYKYQLIEIDGERFFITGKKEMRNGTQLAFDLDQMRVLACAVAFDTAQNKAACMLDELELVELFGYLKERLARYAPKLYGQLKLQADSERDFEKIGLEEKVKVLLGLASIANAQSNVVDLSAMGGKQFAGAMRLTYATTLDKNGIVFIDQSITGMFERRTRIGF